MSKFALPPLRAITIPEGKPLQDAGEPARPVYSPGVDMTANSVGLSSQENFRKLASALERANAQVYRDAGDFPMADRRDSLANRAAAGNEVLTETLWRVRNDSASGDFAGVKVEGKPLDIRPPESPAILDFSSISSTIERLSRPLAIEGMLRKEAPTVPENTNLLATPPRLNNVWRTLSTPAANMEPPAPAPRLVVENPFASPRRLGWSESAAHQPAAPVQASGAEKSVGMRSRENFNALMSAEATARAAEYRNKGGGGYESSASINDTAAEKHKNGGYVTELFWNGENSGVDRQFGGVNYNGAPLKREDFDK